MTFLIFAMPSVNIPIAAAIKNAMILPLLSDDELEWLEDVNIASSIGLSTMKDTTVNAMPVIASSVKNSTLFHGTPQTTFPVCPLTRIVLCLPL